MSMFVYFNILYSEEFFYFCLKVKEGYAMKKG